MANELITAALIAKHFKATEAAVITEIAALKIEGMPFQGQTLYPADATMKALAPRFTPPDPLASIGSGIKAALTTLQTVVINEIELLDNKQDHLLSGLAKLSEQNIILIRTMKSVLEKQDEIIGELKVRDNRHIEFDIAFGGVIKSIDDRLNEMDRSWKLSTGQPVPAAPEQVAKLLETYSKPPKHNPEPTGPEKVQMRRIGIVGLLGSQSNVIESEFKTTFDIRFFLSEDSKGRSFREAIGNCEKVIMMANFVNHGIEDCIKGAGGKLVRIAGGITTLREELHKLSEKETS